METNLNLTPKLFPFQHARYPSIEGQWSIGIGMMKYRFRGLLNLFTCYAVHICVTSCILWHSISHINHRLEIHNLSTGKSEFELKEYEGIGISISNVSAVFKGTINYRYGSWLWVSIYYHQVSAIAQLWFNPMLYICFMFHLLFM